MQATLTYNPRDVLEVRAAITHLEAVAGRLMSTSTNEAEVPAAKEEPKAEAPATTRTRRQKPEPAKEEPKPETPAAAAEPEPAAAAEPEPAAAAAAEPEQPAAAAAAEPEQPAEPDLDNFGDAPEKEYTHDDVRSAIRASLSKNAANREKIGALLGKHTATKQVPDLPKDTLAEVVKAIEAL